MKGLQIALARGNPGDSADEHGMVNGYGLSFNIKPHDRAHGPGTRRPHPYNGVQDGVYLAADAPHESDHGQACRLLYGRLASCPQLAGVNLEAREQNHAKKEVFSRLLNAAGFDRFSFAVTLINEMENEATNQRALNRMVECVSGHKRTFLAACQMEVWTTGRCFCNTPVLRSFDQFGRATVALL